VKTRYLESNSRWKLPVSIDPTPISKALLPSNRVLAVNGEESAKNGPIGVAYAHCDGMDGPVIKAAQQALVSADVNLVLIWVR